VDVTNVSQDLKVEEVELPSEDELSLPALVGSSESAMGLLVKIETLQAQSANDQHTVDKLLAAIQIRNIDISDLQNELTGLIFQLAEGASAS